MIRAICLVVLSGLILPAGISQAQTADPGGNLLRIESELAHLNDSVAQLVLLLQEQIRANRISLLMKRLEMKNAFLQPVETELRTTRDKIRNLEREQAEMEAVLESLGEERNEEAGVDESVLANREREMQTARKSLKDRLWSLNQRVLDLEQDLARGRDEIRLLEEQIEKQFLPKP